jgi:Outer membrane efflux protein
LIVRTRPAFRLRLAPLLAAFALTAGACAPRITPPATSVQASAFQRWDAAGFSDQPFDPRWWRQLEDPVLEELENAALAANRDIQSALARFDQARAVFDEDRRRRYPTVTANGFVDVRELSQPGFSDEPQRITTYRVGLDASWELDLFGQRAELRSGAGKCPCQRRGGSRPQLLRAARHSAAAVGPRPQPRQPARDAAVDRGSA